MKKPAAAAAATLGAMVLTGAALLPNPATAERAAVSARVHTLSLKMHEIGSHDLGRFSFAGSDMVRSASTHKIVGYDAITGTIHPKKGNVVVHVAIALKGGTLVGKIGTSHFEQDPIVFRGPLLAGTGRFKGATGRIVAKSPASDSTKTNVTVTYHF